MNLAILGPRFSGVDQQARKLAELYGWTVVDVEKIVGDKIQWQRELTEHIASNWDPRINDVHFSENEWREIAKGGFASAKDVLPIVLHHLNVPLMKRPMK